MPDLKKLLRVSDDLDPKSVQMLVKAIKDNNREGFDYLEFLAAVEKLEAMPMDRDTAYKSALTTASTFGVTKDVLLTSGGFYLGVLRKEYESFKTALEGQIERRITSPKEKMAQLAKDNEKIDREIEKLKKKKEAQSAKIEEIKAKINGQMESLKAKEEQFHHTFDYIRERIEEDINEIESQL